jgi:hypothetical protein
VKRFRFADGERVEDFPSWHEVFETPNHPDLEGVEGYASRWIRNGQFQYDLVGDNCWLDRTGEVTDT